MKVRQVAWPARSLAAGGAPVVDGTFIGRHEQRPTAKSGATWLPRDLGGLRRKALRVIDPDGRPAGRAHGRIRSSEAAALAAVEIANTCNA